MSHDEFLQTMWASAFGAAFAGYLLDRKTEPDGDLRRRNAYATARRLADAVRKDLVQEPAVGTPGDGGLDNPALFLSVVRDIQNTIEVRGARHSGEALARCIASDLAYSSEEPWPSVRRAIAGTP